MEIVYAYVESFLRVRSFKLPTWHDSKLIRTGLKQIRRWFGPAPVRTRNINSKEII